MNKEWGWVPCDPTLFVRTNPLMIFLNALNCHEYMIHAVIGHCEYFS